MRASRLFEFLAKVLQGYRALIKPWPMVTAFVLAKWLVFKHRDQTLGSSAFLFTAVNVVAVLQIWLIRMGLAMYLIPAIGVQLWVPETANALGVVVAVFTSYLVNKHFSFEWYLHAAG